jgi:hypothetical protein
MIKKINRFYIFCYFVAYNIIDRNNRNY